MPKFPVIRDAKVKPVRLQPKEPLFVFLFAALLALALSTPPPSGAQDKPAAASPDASASKALGTVKSVQPDSITITTASGEVTATLGPSTKIVRVQLGEKDLKNAPQIQPQDLQPGDRVLVRWPAAADPHTTPALSVLVMTQGDISAQRQRESDDWRKRGIDGLVSKMDLAGGSITIAPGGLGSRHDVLIHLTKDTILRRYPPGSASFADARPAPLDQINVGDQLRARGARSQDGAELTAEEIVSGTFRNIAGTITAIDPANNSITVKDLIAKGSPVAVKFSPDSQMKKLPPEMAQRIAVRLKAGAADAEAGRASPDLRKTNAQLPAPSAGDNRRPPDSNAWRGQGAGPGGNGPPDFQRQLSRLPKTALADFQKGESVMIVATQNADSVTAITLLADVDPILTAASSRSAFSLLSAWTLSPSGGGEGETAP